MPAPFTRQLCGYRQGHGYPNTSDSNDAQSRRLGAELFRQLGVPPGADDRGDQGRVLEEKVVKHLLGVRPDLVIKRSRPATDFSQYAHLNVFPSFRKSYAGSEAALRELAEAVAAMPEGAHRERLESLLTQVSGELSKDAVLIETLKREMPEESLLKIDVSVGIPQEHGPDELAIALSSKWSLRTDRAQDCVSQGSKLVAQRRGRMPHFAVVTIEPRPAMLKILADGSGAVDWVYHLDLPALQETIITESNRERKPEQWSPRVTFERLMGQRRLRDFDELVRQVERLPRASVAADESSITPDR